MRSIRTWILVALLVAVSGSWIGWEIAQAVLQDTQNSSGSVNAVAVGSPDLYLCEGGPQAGPNCDTDDQGPEENLFEEEENLLSPANFTGNEVLRLKNIGPLRFDISVFNVNRFRSPNCPQIESVNVTVLGKGSDDINDNHVVQPPDGLPTQSGSQVIVHVEPGDYEDVNIRFSVIGELGDSCRRDGGYWGVGLQVVVAEHQ